MKLDYSLVTRRVFLNTLFGGWLGVLASGSLYGLLKFVFPTLAKEPDFVVLAKADFIDIPPNSVKPFAWGGKTGLFFKTEDGIIRSLKGVCTHMDCNIAYRPDVKKFHCACHEGWFDENGKNIGGPPPRPLEFFEILFQGDQIVIAKKGVKVELSNV